MKLSIRTGIGAVVVAVVLTGCGSLTGFERSDLHGHHARWQAERPEAYTYAVALQCFCAPDALRHVRVSVVGDAVVERVYVDTGEPVPGEVADSYPDVDGLFDVVLDAIERDAHRIDVAYDEATGVPVRIWIDYIENAADEELGYEVVEDVQPTA